MAATTGWTTPEELRSKVMALWRRGAILASLATGEALFPRRLPIRGPAAGELGDRFDEARRWASALRAMPWVRLEERQFRHRQLGANALPRHAWLDSIDDAVALLGKGRERARFEEILALTRRRCPALLGWLGKRPLAALEQARDWSRLLDVVGWMCEHPRPGIHIRQIDLPGVHTKFVERHRGLLSELFDCVLPADAVDWSRTGTRRFERRYGFKTKPERIRFRLLDPSCGDFGFRPQADIEFDADTFAALAPPVAQAFITENEINFLAFPNVPESMVIFGAGYGFEALSRARWLKACRLRYWGDIDTHGFAILNALRGHFPHAESFLMDRGTLLACKPLWGQERSPVERGLPRLTEEEAALHDELRNGRHGERLRLEQERIGFDRVRRALLE